MSDLAKLSTQEKPSPAQKNVMPTNATSWTSAPRPDLPITLIIAHIATSSSQLTYSQTAATLLTTFSKCCNSRIASTPHNRIAGTVPTGKSSQIASTEFCLSLATTAGPQHLNLQHHLLRQLWDKS